MPKLPVLVLFQAQEKTEKSFVTLNESEDDLAVITLAILGWKFLMEDISIFDDVFGHIEGSSASYDFLKPYSESGEKNWNLNFKSSKSQFQTFLGMVYTLDLILGH